VNGEIEIDRIADDDVHPSPGLRPGRELGRNLQGQSQPGRCHARHDSARAAPR
jgi:hypothetical protein